MPILTVNCPCCGKSIPWQPEQIFKPFCSARCKEQDLGAWATGAYVIATPVEDMPEQDDQVPPQHDDYNY